MSAEGQSEARARVTWSEVTNQRPPDNISLARCKSIPDSDLLLVSAPGERSRIETCKPAEKIGKYPFHFYFAPIRPPSLAIVWLLFCLVKNVCVTVSLHSSKNWVSCIICLRCKAHYYQHETDPRLRLHYSAITVPGKTLSYKFLDYLGADIPTFSSLLPCSDHPAHVSHHTPGLDTSKSQVKVRMSVSSMFTFKRQQPSIVQKKDEIVWF